MAGLVSAHAMLDAMSSEDVATIASGMEHNGIWCIPDFLAGDDLAQMRDFVGKAIKDGGDKSISLGSDQLRGSGLDELAESEAFKKLFSALYVVNLNRPAPPVKFHQVLRCLTGESSAKHSYMFHYDSFIITALIPVEMPTSGRKGDFLMIPNTRSVRSNYVLSLIDKVLLDNRITQRWLRRSVSSKRIKRVTMQPGSLYLFWGYRSIHTNEPCDEGSVRATALFHYADPHADSRLKRRLRGSA